MVHVYFGDGKGKTTAAVGAAIRAAGHGLRIGFCQFLKDGSSGECTTLRQLPGVIVFPAPSPMPFLFQMNDADRQRIGAFYRELFETLHRALSELDMLILDEALDAEAAGLLENDALTALVHLHPEREFLLTGHTLTPQWRETADYLTHMQKLRHPYDSGISGRSGVEW